ncbi:unnamed protein product [Ectocarpus fasciculatus]
MALYRRTVHLPREEGKGVGRRVDRGPRGEGPSKRGGGRTRGIGGRPKGRKVPTRGGGLGGTGAVTNTARSHSHGNPTHSRRCYLHSSGSSRSNSTHNSGRNLRRRTGSREVGGMMGGHKGARSSRTERETTILGDDFPCEDRQGV